MGTSGMPPPARRERRARIASPDERSARVQAPASAPLRVLHVGAERFPQVKTGGLGDVLAALPRAQLDAGDDARVLLPGHPALLDALAQDRVVAELGPAFGAARVTLRQGRLPDGVTALLVDAPLLYRRAGDPYHGPDCADWPDNLQRFALLGWVAAQLAAGSLDAAWTPDVVHAHDWHAGMACAYLKAHAATAPSVFTIHNLAYQGLFPLADGALLGLPGRHLQTQGLEFHGALSLMKAGLQYADRITTVSPTYAREIATPAFGHGLDGVIRDRCEAVSGILNGMDGRVWDPATDPVIAARYGPQDPAAGKAACAQALRREAGLAPEHGAPLLLALSRLTHQKGLDLLLQVLPWWLSQGGQAVVQGSGEATLEDAFETLARAHPGRLAVLIGYDEARAHRLMAGADLIAVPSRFEPCGLTQLYGLRYGTLPVVRRTGGLADTVVDAGATPGRAAGGTGFVFEESTGAALAHALWRARQTFDDPAAWGALQRQAMTRDFSWRRPVAAYRRLYDALRASMAGHAATGPVVGATGDSA